MTDMGTTPIPGYAALKRKADAFSVSLTSMRKQLKISSDFCTIDVVYIDECGQKVTERYGDVAAKKRTESTTAVGSPQRSAKTPNEVLKTAAFGAWQKLEHDLGGGDAVLMLCQTWISDTKGDTKAKSNFAQSLMWHYANDHMNALEKMKITTGTTAVELFDTFATYKAFLIKAKAALAKEQSLAASVHGHASASDSGADSGARDGSPFTGRESSE
jgi:hypothetical protein